MNEYHEKFEELQEKNTFRGQTWFGERQNLVEAYSWAVPNDDVLTYISQFDERIYEVGAGNGYWSHLLQERGADVMPIDIDPPADTWTDVHVRDVSNLHDMLEGSVVLTVWPPYDEEMSFEIVAARPNHVLYVGEGRGGCTGCDEFFNRIESEYGLVAKIDIPSYQGIHDQFYHYVRKV